MSRKYPKKIRKQREARLKAADAFVEAWTTSGLAGELICEYNCTLNCGEANTFNDLLRSFGYPNTAESMLADHVESCETRHLHDTQGVWTFFITAHNLGLEDEPEYVIVAGGDGAQAEDRALAHVRARVRQDFPEQTKTYHWVRVDDVQEGVPSSTALWGWADIRSKVAA